jgi:hypothetical protein
VGDERGAPRGEDLKVQRRYAVEEAFAGTHGDRCDMGVELVYQASGQVLVDRGGRRLAWRKIACRGYRARLAACEYDWSPLSGWAAGASVVSLFGPVNVANVKW